MGSEHLRQPAGDPAHEVGRTPVEAIDPFREVQRFLDLPDLIVLVGWQDARRVANGHPSDRHHGARLKARAQVDRGVHSDFATPSDHGAVEDRGAGGHEHLVLERRAGDVSARPDQAVVTDRARMFGASPNHGVLHDDPVAPDPDGATGLTDEAGAVQDAHARSDRDVAAQRGIGCHPGRRIDRWTLARMLDQHRLVPAPWSVVDFTNSYQIPIAFSSETHCPSASPGWGKRYPGSPSLNDGSPRSFLKLSLPGLTRQSIRLRKKFLRTGWIRGSSPRMTRRARATGAPMLASRLQL